MRTRLSQRHSRSGALRWSVIALAFAALFLLARILLPGLFLTVTAPFLTFGDRLSGRVSGFFAGAGDARALAKENAALAAQNADLTLENGALTAKVADLTALIGTTTPAARGILASVVARPPETPYDTLVLAAGSAAGLAPAMEVVGPAGTPLGLIESVTPDFSRARLFSAAGVLTDAWVGAARVPIGLKGVGGSFSASLPQGSGIAAGDLVYISGPGAVPVGRVARITGAASDPVVTLAIAPLVNVLSLPWVEVAGTPLAASSTLLAPPSPVSAP